MNKADRLVIPTCSGVLDCFNARITRYYQKESFCCLKGEGNSLLLLALFSFLYLYHYSLESCTYTFKMSAFKQYIGYSGGGKSIDLPSALLQLQQVGYLWDYAPHPQVVEVSYNTTHTLVTIKSEYFQKIIKHMATFNGTLNKYGKKLKNGSPSYSSMVYTSILKEKNKSAIECAIEMVKLVERRGHLEEGENAHISIGTLIERCPTLYQQVEKAKATGEKNRVAKTAIIKGIELLKKHTSLYESFSNLTFELPEKISFGGIVNVNYLRRNIA